MLDYIVFVRYLFGISSFCFVYFSLLLCFIYRCCCCYFAFIAMVCSFYFPLCVFLVDFYLPSPFLSSQSLYVIFLSKRAAEQIESAFGFSSCCSLLPPLLGFYQQRCFVNSSSAAGCCFDDDDEIKFNQRTSKKNRWVLPPLLVSSRISCVADAAATVVFLPFCDLISFRCRWLGEVCAVLTSSPHHIQQHCVIQKVMYNNTRTHVTIAGTQNFVVPFLLFFLSAK